MNNFNDKYQKKNPFTVPDNYFDQLTDRIMEQTKSEKKKGKLKFMQIIKPYMGLVGIFVVILFVTQVILPLSVDKSEELMKISADLSGYAEELPDEYIFDSHFNPTGEEIIEYLTLEVDNYELVYAGIY